MSSDEEEIDPAYVAWYQHRVEGKPLQNATDKGKGKATFNTRNEGGMDWETTDELKPTGNGSTTQKDEMDEDDTIVYSDPDDRQRTPVASGVRDNVRMFAAQNPKFSSSRYRKPLGTINNREHIRSSRGRNPGTRPRMPNRPPQHPRGFYRPSPQLFPPSPSSPYVQRHTRQQKFSPMPPDEGPSEIHYEEPFQPPLPPTRKFYPKYRPWRPQLSSRLKDIKLTDNAHFVPEREDLRWSNRKHEKGAGRFSRKRKGLSFFDTFERKFALPSNLRFADQVPSQNERHSSDDEDEAGEAPAMEEPVMEEPIMEEPIMEEPIMEEDLQENVETDFAPPMSPTPELPTRPRFQARKVIEISDDSEPESMQGSNESGLGGQLTHDSDIEEYQPASNVVAPPPDAILHALRPITSHYALPKLPFLKRNLKRSFYHLFLSRIMTKRRSLPKIPDSTASWSSVSWEYHTGFGSTSWENVQEGWTCQLCNIFPSFTLGSALMYHLQRDHPAVGARRKKLGFKKWKIIIDLVRPISPISPAILTHESSPLPELVPPVIDDTSSIEEEVIIEEDLRVPTTTTHMGDKVEARRYRVGGTKCYDLAMQEMPMPLRGIAAKTFECRENDMCLFTKCSDEEKAMAIIWGRWICQYRLDFIKQPLQNAILFVDTHWDLIRRTAEFEGLIRWLMTMKFHHYFSQGQVAAISKRYQRHLP